MTARFDVHPFPVGARAVVLRDRLTIVPFEAIAAAFLQWRRPLGEEAP